MKQRSMNMIIAVLAVFLALPAFAGTIQLRQSNGTLTDQGGTGSSASVNLTGQLGGEHVDPNTEENGYIRVQPRAGTVGGASVYSRLSAGSTEDEHEVCSAACTLYSITATNTNAEERYLKCFNALAANTTPGTSTPGIRLAVPGATTGAGLTISFPVGVSFSTGLTCWLVTGVADSDVAEVAANELIVNYSYKQ